MNRRQAEVLFQIAAKGRSQILSTVAGVYSNSHALLRSNGLNDLNSPEIDIHLILHSEKVVRRKKLGDRHFVWRPIFHFAASTALFTQTVRVIFVPFGLENIEIERAPAQIIIIEPQKENGCVYLLKERIFVIYDGVPDADPTLADPADFYGAIAQYEW